MINIMQGDCYEVLKTIPEKSIQCCVTSPPYWGLRDYGVDGQLGLEKTPEEYVDKLVGVFREVRRVLKDDGVLWLNLGDSYTNNSVPGGGDPTIKQRNIGKSEYTPTVVKGLKPKNLVGIPWRVAFALQQPYTIPSCVKNETDRAWLAAMFDSDGCIGIRRFASYRKEKQQIYQDGFVAYTVVTNNDIELLERCVTITGKGNIKLKQKAESTDKRGIVSRKNSYGWRLDGNDAIAIIRAMYPYLIAKRKQACLAYALDVIHKDKKRVDGKVPKETQDKKTFLYESIKKCNQRDSVDIPSWIVEPKGKIEDGWYLRQDIIWNKPNPMPESVTDRCTKAHEYIFLLSKSQKYYYDNDAIKENSVDPESYKGRRARGPKSIYLNSSRPNNASHQSMDKGYNELLGKTYKKRNKRSVWTVNTKPYKHAHFAVFPKKLIEPCILAGSKAGDTVLDPFGGSGTTGEVALEHHRNAVLIELNSDYVKLQHKRISSVQRVL